MTTAIRFTLNVRDSWRNYTARADRVVTCIARSNEDAIQAYMTQTTYANVEFRSIAHAIVAEPSDLDRDKENDQYFICPSLKEDIDSVPGEAIEPRVQAWKMEPIPKDANPFNHDTYHMGTSIVRGWWAMHRGFDADTAEKGGQFPIEYMILINTRTGNRVKIKIEPEF